MKRLAFFALLAALLGAPAIAEAKSKPKPLRSCLAALDLAESEGTSSPRYITNASRCRRGVNAADTVTDVAPATAPVTTPPTTRAQAAPRNPGTITFAEYEALQTGMSYEEAVEIIGGPGQEISRSDLAGFVTVMYQWTGSGGIGANANAMFQNGGLVTKAQFGLR